MTERTRPSFDEVFIGRNHVLRQLRTFKDKLRQGTGAVVLLFHEAGIGKTTLVEWFLTQVRNEADAPAIFTAQCIDIAMSRQPFEPFSRLLEQMAETKDHPYGQVFKRLGPKLLEGLPWVGPVLGELLRLLLKGERKETASLSFSADAAIWEYVELLRDLAKVKPMILFIDDLQWSDASSANLLFGIARRISEMPIMLIGNYRSEELEDTKQKPARSLRDVLLELRRYRLVTIFELKLFSTAEVEAYLDAVFSPNDFSSDFTTRLADQTGGSPFFLEAVTSWLYETDYIAKENGVWHATLLPDEIPVPDGVESAILRRVGLLENGQQRLLRYASAQGKQFRSQVLAQTLHMDRLEVLEALGEIAFKSRLLQELARPELRAYEADWSFNHSLVQQTLYNTLGRNQRVELHWRVAAILESTFPGQLNLLAWELARHYRAGHQWKQAARYGLRATRVAYRAQSYIDTIDAAEAALADLDHVPDMDLIIKADLHWLLSRSQAHLQKFRLSEDNAQHCLRAAEQIGDVLRQISALTRLAEVYLRQRRIEDLNRVYTSAWQLAREQHSAVMMAYVAQFWVRDMAVVLPELTKDYAETAITAAREQNNLCALILALPSLGKTVYRSRDYDQALPAFEEALQLIAALPVQQLQQFVLDDLPIMPSIRYKDIWENCLEFVAHIHRETGQWRQSIDELWQVFHSKVRHSDKPGEVGLKSVISETYLMAGEVEIALKLHEEALKLAESLESQRLLALILGVGLQIAARKGDMELLQEKLARFKQVEGAQEDYWCQSLALEMEGVLALGQGDVEMATRAYERMLKLANEYDDQTAQANALAGLAACALKGGKKKRARTLGESALERQRVEDPRRKGDTLILLARIYQAAEDPAKAREALEQARGFFIERDYTYCLEEVEALLEALQ
jgi:tetratricopeptide (TPR) repeat protein